MGNKRSTYSITMPIVRRLPYEQVLAMSEKYQHHLSVDAISKTTLQIIGTIDKWLLVSKVSVCFGLVMYRRDLTNFLT